MSVGLHRNKMVKKNKTSLIKVAFKLFPVFFFHSCDFSFVLFCFLFFSNTSLLRLTNVSQSSCPKKDKLLAVQ